MPSILSQTLVKKPKSTSKHSSSQPTPFRHTGNATSTLEAAPEPRRSSRSRRPSVHQVESDEYQASSRGSSRPPTPSEPAPKPKPRTLPRGKPGDRPGRITQPDSDIGSTRDEGSPEPPATAGLQPGDSRVANQSLAGKPPKATERAEAVRRASAYLGVDASRYPQTTLEKILAAIPDGGEESDTNAMEIEGGSAPAQLQSTGRVGLASGHQPSATGAIGTAINDDSATESESELELAELGPGDSVSQQPPRLPPSPRVSSRSPPLNPRPSCRTDEAEVLGTAPMVIDTTAANGSGTSGPEELSENEIEQARARKRPRLAQSVHTVNLSRPHVPSISGPSTARARPTHLGTPLIQGSTPVLALNQARITPTAYQPTSSLSSNLLEPPPMSDIHGVLTWAARLAQHASRTAGGSRIGASRQSSRASQPDALYGTLAQVLGDLGSHLSAPPPTSRRVVSRSKHMSFVDDNAEFLEAEAALALGKHFPSRGKPTLADFPGLPRRIASLAIPDLITTACTQGAYEVFSTISEWADEAFDDTWNREVPDEPRIQIPRPLNSLMVRRVSWFRGEAKKRGRPEVSSTYPFINPPENSEDYRYNRMLAAELLPNSFHFLDPEAETDPYENPALCHCIAALFFWAPDAFGVIYRTKFNPIPIPAVAMVLTIMQHCIQEWSTGRFVPAVLDADLQAKTYASHLRGLLEYAKVASGRLLDFRTEWFNYGMNYAGVQPNDYEEPFQPITRADQVRAETPTLNGPRTKGKGRAVR